MQQHQNFSIQNALDIPPIHENCAVATLIPINNHGSMKNWSLQVTCSYLSNATIFHSTTVEGVTQDFFLESPFRNQKQINPSVSSLETHLDNFIEARANQLDVHLQFLEGWGYTHKNQRAISNEKQSSNHCV